MNKYILFEYDHGGPNNIIMSIKFILFIALLTKRTIIIPKKQAIYHFDWGPNGKIDDLNDFDKIEETELSKLIDILELKKSISIISFQEFFEKEKKNLKLPKNFMNFSRLYNDYETMKIQGKRLQKDESENRGKYWSARARYLKSINADSIKNKNNDWVNYSKKHFKTLPNMKVNKFINIIKKTHDKIIFLPMDNYFNTSKYKYLRIFWYMTEFKPQKKNHILLWNTVLNINIYNSKFYEIVKIIKEKYIGCDYDALHYRYNGFNEKNNFTGEQIIDKIKKYVKSSILYIASDSFDLIFKNLKTETYPFKILSIKDFFVENYLDDLKYISFIELILCIKSNTFIGTNFSSFTSEIISSRKNKNVLFKNLYNETKNDPHNFVIGKK
jgi:hypothetical protein